MSKINMYRLHVKDFHNIKTNLRTKKHATINANINVCGLFHYSVVFYKFFSQTRNKIAFSSILFIFLYGLLNNQISMISHEKQIHFLGYSQKSGGQKVYWKEYITYYQILLSVVIYKDIGVMDSLASILLEKINANC